ncbi:hypothetical protein HDZ31DRAFT_67186 [Schizophyllum fasciatum]
MPSTNRSPPLLVPVSLTSATGSTELADEQRVDCKDNAQDPQVGQMLYALGYLTTPARIAREAARRGFGVCGDPALTVHAFLRRLENATGVCEGHGLLEVRSAEGDEVCGDARGCEGAEGNERDGGNGEVSWLILVKGTSPRVADMVVPDVLLHRFQECMPTEEMPVLYRIAVNTAGEKKMDAKPKPSHSHSRPPPICRCPRRARLVLGYATSPAALFRHACRAGTDVRGDVAATLERVLRRIRRTSHRALADTVLKLSGGGWLLVVADVGSDYTLVGQEGLEGGAALAALAEVPEATVRAFQRIVGTLEAPGVYSSLRRGAGYELSPYAMIIGFTLIAP